MELVPINDKYREIFEGLVTPTRLPIFYQPQFEQLYQLPVGTWLVINYGPRGGGKSFEASEFITMKVLNENKRCVVLRDEKTNIEESILSEIKSRFNEIDEASNGYFSKLYDMQNNALKKKNETKNLIFTKGFRTSSNQKTASLKSISDVDIALIEEFEDLRDKQKFNKFADSIRKENSLIIINSNIPDKNHWFVTTYFDLKETEHEGYFELIPKNIPGVVYIFSNYKQNKYLTDSIVDKYTSYGIPEHPFYDKEYYLTQMIGYCSSGRKGQIYNNWHRISDDEFNKLPYKSYYGLDFGSSSPTALVEAKFHDNLNYFRELIYLTNFDDTLKLAKRMIELGIKPSDYIIADSAKPLEIGRLRRGWTKDELDAKDVELYPTLIDGFNIFGAVKGPGSIENGIKELKSCINHVADSSLNFWNVEYPQYCWALDKNGNPTDVPLDDFNHLFDAIRYVKSGKNRVF